MEEETTYSDFDLESGICTCCNEESEEILIEDGRCIDCIEDYTTPTSLIRHLASNLSTVKKLL